MATTHQPDRCVRNCVGGGCSARCIGENPEARRTGTGKADVEAIRLNGEGRLRLGAVGQHGVCGGAQVIADAAHVGDERRSIGERRERSREASRPWILATDSCANTDLVLPNGAALCGQASTASRRGSASTVSTCSPTPHTSELRSARHTDTSAPSAAASLSQSTPLAGLMRRTARSTAAASAEPPPMPAAMGSCLSTVTRPRVRIGIGGGEALQRRVDKIAAGDG